MQSGNRTAEPTLFVALAQLNSSKLEQSVTPDDSETGNFCLYIRAPERRRTRIRVRARAR